MIDVLRKGQTRADGTVFSVVICFVADRDVTHFMFIGH